MPRDLRLSRMLHVLIHMDRHVTLATSEQISKMISTNPVVVRRMMGGLRDRGIVTSEKGHGGGWKLALPLSDVTLRDVYEAVGAPPLFNIGPNADPSACLVEQAAKDVESRAAEQPGGVPAFGAGLEPHFDPDA